MPPEKKSKKSSSVKSPSKKTVKTPPRETGGNGPFYMLVIIILVTVIVLLLNKFYENGKFTIPYPKEIAVKGDSVKKESKEKSAEDKATAQNSSDSDKNQKAAGDDEKKAVENKEVVVYFLRIDEKSEKTYLSTVKRKISDKQLLSSTLEQLIKGPTPYEKGRGYLTAVPSHLKIKNIEMKGNTAEIDFNGVIEEGAAGDIILKRIQQIVNTATQFDNVESIIIKINGQKRKTIGGDGLFIGGPLRRT